MQINRELITDIEAHELTQKHQYAYILGLFTYLSQHILEEKYLIDDPVANLAFLDIVAKRCYPSDFRYIAGMVNGVNPFIINYAMENQDWKKICDAILKMDDAVGLEVDDPKTEEKRQYVLDHASKFGPDFIKEISPSKNSHAVIVAKEAELLRLKKKLEQRKKHTTE